MSKLFENGFSLLLKDCKLDNIELTHFRKSDLGILKFVLTNDEICNAIGAEPVTSIDNIKSYLFGNIKAGIDNNCISDRLAIRYRGCLIGCISYIHRKTAHEVGYWLLKEYRNKNIMSEALIKTSDMVTGMRYNLFIRASNIGSYKTAIKAGFIEDTSCEDSSYRLLNKEARQEGI